MDDQKQFTDDKSLVSVIDVFCLKLAKQHNQKEIQEIENDYNVKININEDYGQIHISKGQRESQKTHEEWESIFQSVGYKIIELTTIQSNKLQEGKMDCNPEFFQKIQRRLKQQYESKNRSQDYEIELITNDIERASVSTNNYKPMVVKSFNIKGKFVVKICKIEQPDLLNFDKIDVIIMNMTNTGIYLDEFGYMLQKSNKELSTLIKSLKKNITSDKFIDEKHFTFGNRNVSLLIQLEDDEQSCINRLIQILDKIRDQKFSQKGNLRIYIGWRACCGMNYFDALYKYIESHEQQKTYLQFPTEICFITDEGLESLVVQIAQNCQFNHAVKGKIEFKNEIVWNINNVRYPKFIDQNTPVPGCTINKEIADIIEKAISLKITEFYFAMKLDGKEAQFFQTPKQLGLNPDLIDRLKLNLKTLKETNLSQSQTNQIMNQCDFYYYLHPFQEDFVMYQETVQNVIRSYVKLGIVELRLEKDGESQEVITPIFFADLSKGTIQQCAGTKNLVYLKRQERKVQVMTTEQKQAIDDLMKLNVVEFLQSDQAEKVYNLTQKSKPVIQIRARPQVYEEIKQFINKLKLDCYVSHQIKCSKAINSQQRQYIEDQNLKENIEINLIDDSSLIYGYKKTLNRLLPIIMNQLCENLLAEQQVYAIPSYWENQERNHKLVEISFQTDEANKIIQLFEQSYKARINKIFRIQNISLWKNYQFEKETLLQKGNASEKLLFHGPGQNINPETIYSETEEGFDFRNQANGIFGRGAHFNEQASIANQTAFVTGNAKQILLASVLLGKSFVTSSNQTFSKPPAIPNTSDQRYDSVKTDKSDGQNTYVVYHNSKAYPYYVIDYSN